MNSASAAVSAETRAMIERLIAFDTTSRNSNLELIHDVRDYLRDLGVESELVFDADGAKANLYATLGPTDRGGIALSGHSDVVPIDGQAWDTDPWTVVEKDGLLYGRGTCDMKSFVAVALAYAPRILEMNLPVPIHLCISYDEEVGCIGVRSLLEFLSSRAVRPKACIVGEPTEMKVITAHKGKVSMRCHVHGFECHSSLAPQGVNAVEVAARLITKIADMGVRKASEGPFDSAFDISHTTAHTGVIQGGTALNIVPKDCFFDFEFRHLPEDDPEALMAEVRDYAQQTLEPAMKAVRPETGFTWEPLSTIPALDMPEDAEVIQLAKALTGANTTSKVAFGTEAGLFQRHEIPTVVCGPGAIAQAHKPNEFVSLDQVARCEAFMDRLLERLSAEGDA